MICDIRSMLPAGRVLIFTISFFARTLDSGIEQILLVQSAAWLPADEPEFALDTCRYIAQQVARNRFLNKTRGLHRIRELVFSLAGLHSIVAAEDDPPSNWAGR